MTALLECSLHGVENSIIAAHSCPCFCNSCMVESDRQYSLRMAEYAREIRKSCATILELLQEEIDATESESTTDTLPSIEPTDEESAEELVGLRTSMVESVTPIVRMPLLNEITDTFPKGITRFADTPDLEIPLFNLSSCKGVVVHIFGILINSSSSNFDPPLLPTPKPPDQNFPKIIVELPVICNLMLPPPPPKPPYSIHRDVDITVLLSGVEIVCAKRMVIKTELSLDYDHCILREDLVYENRYDNSIMELVFVSFNALILYVKCSESFAHQVAIYIFQVWNAHHVFDVMPKMTMVCLNSLNVGIIIAGVLDEKELLSSEFVNGYPWTRIV